MQGYLPTHLPIYPSTCHLYLLSHLCVISACYLPTCLPFSSTHLPVISIYHLPTYPLTCLPYASACLPIYLSSLRTRPCTYHLSLPPPFLLTYLSSLPTTYMPNHLPVISTTSLPTFLPVISTYCLPTYPPTCHLNLHLPTSCLPVISTYHLPIHPPIFHAYVCCWGNVVQFGFETVGWFGGGSRGGRSWGRVWARGDKNSTEAAMALPTEVGGGRYSRVGSDLSH